MLLELIPAFGGRIGRLAFEGLDVLVPLTATSFDPVAWPQAGAYPMIPYHNRIETGRLCLNGHVHTIASHKNAAPHSLHGPAQRDPWTVISQSKHQIVLQLDRDADEHWPWAFRAQQDFALLPDGLKLTLTVVNQSGESMPAGLGWHPYVAQCRQVQHDAEYNWPIGLDYLPAGGRQAVGHCHADLVTGTSYYSCWSQLEIETGSGLALSITATPVLSHLVLHKGDGDYVCVEPVSHLANGFNMHDRGVLGTGTRILIPGEELSGTISVTVRRAG
ncbi:hypothetical protein [Pelagibacterium sp. H642]|uniref:aldose epimerase family protein n=1 Tax=Pelagibacterium sp. H642 TaxID=1881069 RepID=UPI002815F356|nr:hypothetical protein [Pelagibacterium sp. H642]WMT91886.1 hypothetical protein NO934_06390 [Pelagibacterium sp. H642]